MRSEKSGASGCGLTRATAATMIAASFLLSVAVVVVSVSTLTLIVSTSVATAESPLPTPEPTPAEATRRASEILSRPEYQPPPESLPQKAINWITEKISEVIQTLVDGGQSSVISWIVMTIIVGLIALMVWRVIKATAKSARVESAPVVGFEVDQRRSADEWRTEAERYESDGNWKEALRCRYRALLADLVDRGVLREIPGRTSGEYRADVVVAQPGLAGEFSGASDLFDDAWYGDLPTGAPENVRFRDLATRVVSGVGR